MQLKILLEDFDHNTKLSISGTSLTENKISSLRKKLNGSDKTFNKDWKSRKEEQRLGCSFCTKILHLESVDLVTFVSRGFDSVTAN